MKHTALITGAAGGIGTALAETMLAQGYRVLGLDRTPCDLKGVEPLLCDLLDPAAVAEAAARLAGEGLTHIVHNAGAIRPALLDAADPADVAALAQLHLAAPLALTQAALAGMKARRFGRILFTGSRAGLGVPTRSAYAATKAGLLGLARTWALELAPHGITVNVVAPGPIRTENFWEIVPKGSDREADLARRLPVGRLGEPADVARALMFFAAPEAGFVTGQCLYVCGGASLGALPL